jgi:hypothetical protein
VPTGAAAQLYGEYPIAAAVVWSLHSRLYGRQGRDLRLRTPALHAPDIRLHRREDESKVWPKSPRPLLVPMQSLPGAASCQTRLSRTEDAVANADKGGLARDESIRGSSPGATICLGACASANLARQRKTLMQVELRDRHWPRALDVSGRQRFAHLLDQRLAGEGLLQKEAVT